MGEAPRKLTLERILLYSLASAGLNIMSITVSPWILYFYAPPPDSGRIQYLPAALVGILLTVGSLWDAVIDPSWLCLFCRANLATYSPKGRQGHRRWPGGPAARQRVREMAGPPAYRCLLRRLPSPIARDLSPEGTKGPSVAAPLRAKRAKGET
jgi:hypothetical protein